MWPFKKKKKQKENQTNVKEDVKIPEEAVVLPGTPGMPIEPIAPVKPVEPQNSEKTEEVVKPIDLESMTVVELKALAKERGLQGYSALKKAELIDQLK